MVRFYDTPEDFYVAEALEYARAWRQSTPDSPAGMHDNPFGMRLTALMIAKWIPDAAVPMSLLADHPDVVFNYSCPAIGSCTPAMH